MTDTATDMIFRNLFHDGLVLVGAASGSAMSVRDIYRAAVLRQNPKHALAIIRELHGKLDETGEQLAHFRAGILTLAAQLEAAVAPDPQP